MEDRIESDHFPVVVWIKRVRLRSGLSRRVGGGRRKRWRWTEEGKRGFRERIEGVAG